MEIHHTVIQKKQICFITTNNQKQKVECTCSPHNQFLKVDDIKLYLSDLWRVNEKFGIDNSVQRDAKWVYSEILKSTIEPQTRVTAIETKCEQSKIRTEELQKSAE